jgi:hypothetical protein
VPERSAPRLLVPARLSVLLPGALSVLGTALFVVRGESALVRILWLGSMAALVALLLRNHVPDRERPWPGLEILGVLALTGLAFFLRFYQLANLPQHTDNDVALMGAYTLDLMDQKDARFFGLYASDHLLSFHQILASGMRLFGLDHEGLVITSVLAGTATIPALYLLGRELYGGAPGSSRRRSAVSYTHYHASRILSAPSHVPLTLRMALLFRGFRTGAPCTWRARGSADSDSTHYSGRVGPVILGCLLLASFTLVKRAQQPSESLGLGDLRWVPGLRWMLAYMVMELRLFTGRGSRSLSGTRGCGPTRWRNTKRPAPTTCS